MTVCYWSSADIPKDDSIANVTIDNKLYYSIPCTIKRNYVKTALCDLGASVSVMPLSLYCRLELNS